MFLVRSTKTSVKIAIFKTPNNFMIRKLKFEFMKNGCKFFLNFIYL